MMNPYHEFVSAYAPFAQEGKKNPPGPFPKCPHPAVAPHSDDEVIIGGLALRLLRQSRWNVINVAVTQGSKPERQAGRLAELKACCDCIGFGVVQTAPNGLERVNAQTREQDPAFWARS